MTIEYELKEIEHFAVRHLHNEWVKEWRNTYSACSYNKVFDISIPHQSQKNRRENG